jgi:nucleotide-binding universal stress UspA family protein
MMFTRILVPLDGSPSSERVLPYVLAIARALKASVILLHAVPPSTSEEVEPEAAGTITRLTELVSALRDQGIDVWMRVYDEPAGQAIIAAADQERADLIVMSTHGRGGLGRWLYGSVADEVLRHTTQPIGLISATCDRVWATGRAFRMLVPLDGSDFAEQALEAAAAVATAVSGELLLLRVVEPTDELSVLGPPYLQDALDAARGYLDRVADRPGINPVTTGLRVEAGDPAATIAAVARREDVDVVMMATHGSGGLVRLALGSVASDTLHRVTTPLLLVRPGVTLHSQREEANDAPGAASRPGRTARVT